jgi:transcription elongation factor GreA
MSTQENPAVDPGAVENAPETEGPRPLSKDLLADEALADLSLEAIETLRASADEAEASGLAMAIRMVTEVLEGDRKCLPARLAQGLLQEKLEDPSPAATTYVVLSRDLLAADNIEAARWVARRGLGVHPDHRMVDVLLKVAARQPEIADEDVALCREHLAEAPELLWHDSQAADEAGDTLRAANLAVDAAVGFVAIDSLDDAENAILRVLDCPDPAVVGRLIDALPAMVGSKGSKEVLDLAMELGTSTFEAMGLHGRVADALKSIMEKRGEDPALREAFVSSLAVSLGGEKAIGGLLDKTGLRDAEVPFRDALHKYEELAVYLPGTHVFDSDWGVGKVKAHDGEFLTIDFQNKPGHRLSLQIAETAVSVVPDTMVAVAYYEDPETLETERDEDPASLVVRAIEQEGGDIAVKELKEILTRDIVAPEDWSNWWKKARNALKKDPRIDHTQTFRDMIRLAPEGEEPAGETAVDIPILDTKKGMKSAATMINKLLKEYPEAEERAQAAYADALAIALDSERSADARLSVLPFLARWKPHERSTWVSYAGGAIENGGDVCAVTDPEGQKVALELALESDAWQEAAVAGLRSKHEDVVQAAWEALALRGRADLRAALEEELTSNLPAAAAVQLCRVILEGWDDLEPSRRPQPWLVLAALLAAAGPQAPTKAAETARKLLSSGDDLRKVLAEADPPSSAMTERFRSTVRRGLEDEVGEAVLDLLERAGHDELVADIRADEVVVADDTADLPESDEDITLMTRATREILQDRLKKNRARLAVVLDDLEKARQFGDLSENSEYETAREQRAMLLSSIEATTRDLEKAQFIEDLKVDEGVARVGTQITLREGDGERTIWLLGEGDSHLGDEVVSYKAPLGQALIGRKEGESVPFDMEGGTSEVEILKVERRLP